MVSSKLPSMPLSSKPFLVYMIWSALITEQISYLKIVGTKNNVPLNVAYTFVIMYQSSPSSLLPMLLVGGLPYFTVFNEWMLGPILIWLNTGIGNTGDYLHATSNHNMHPHGTWAMVIFIILHWTRDLSQKSKGSSYYIKTHTEWFVRGHDPVTRDQ